MTKEIVEAIRVAYELAKEYDNGDTAEDEALEHVRHWLEDQDEDQERFYRESTKQMPVACGPAQSKVE